MYVTLKGKLIAVTKQDGQKADGTKWEKYQIVLEDNDGSSKYPKHVAITVWGDKWKELALCNDTTYELDCDIDAREWQGKWYNDIVAFRIHQAQRGAGTDVENKNIPFFSN